MSIKSLLLSIILSGFLTNISIGVEKPDFGVIEDQLWELEENKLYDEIISLLDSIKADYPENGFEISDWYANAYLSKKQFDKAYSIWESGHGMSYFYLLHPQLPPYKEIAEADQFKKLSEKDLQLRNKALQKSKTLKEIVLPNNYDSKNKYPLLIVLHGGRSTIERSIRNWHSEKLNNEFIIMFVQSYRHYNLKKFGWRSGDERAHNDIKALFNETTTEYNIDTAKVIIGGISAGGVMAIDIASNNIIPIAGFLGICPAEPKGFNVEIANKMKELKLKGYIVAGETDFYRERQNNMMKIFDETEFPYEFHEIKGMGHEYPKDFEDWIDKGLIFLFS